MGMSGSFDEFARLVTDIENRGFIKSTRKGPTGIGKLFEDLLGKEEDNAAAPDFGDIEIKVHDGRAGSMITLFTKAPTSPRQANTYLRENYGAADPESGLKSLHATVTATRRTNSNVYDYDFQIFVDEARQRVVQLVFDKSGNMIDDSVYWSFDVLAMQMELKLRNLALVHAEKEVRQDGTYYRYTGVDYIKDINIDMLIPALIDGAVKVDNRIGSYKSGRNFGKTHDHGTGFRITQSDLLYYGNVTDKLIEL